MFAALPLAGLQQRHGDLGESGEVEAQTAGPDGECPDSEDGGSLGHTVADARSQRAETGNQGPVDGDVQDAAYRVPDDKRRLSAVRAEKILDRAALVKRIQEWRVAGETIVFTNGCFDLLHVGHVTLLEECHKFGSKLVLGLNTDASVQRLKGASRPVVPENERARVMSALAAVDAVVLFDEDTQLELIRAVRPDVLVKGGDYTVETVVGHADVIAAGGRVEIVPTVEGFSTTNLVLQLAGR